MVRRCLCTSVTILVCTSLAVSLNSCLSSYDGCALTARRLQPIFVGLIAAE
jgi:hypothetical protein